jgi:hypothetical protein
MKGNFLLTLGCVLVMLASCGMRTTRLRDNGSKIPKRTSVYKNRIKFDSTALRYIDTGVVYEEYNTWNKVLIRLDSTDKNSSYGIYRFYSNGFMNYFSIDRNKPLVPKDFDPEYHGYRGIYYMNNNKLTTELFAPVNGLGHIGKRKEKCRISGDTLFVGRESVQYPQVYIKRKLPAEYLTYRIPN